MTNPDPMSRTGLVIVISTSAAEGARQDRSGVILAEGLTEMGVDVLDTLVVSDVMFDQLWTEVSARPDLPDLIITSGGTGLTPDDRTVEIIAPTLERELPGLVHRFFAIGAVNTPMAVLSRATAGTIGTSLVMALPGSTGAAKDGLKVLEPILHHALDQLNGIKDH